MALSRRQLLAFTALSTAVVGAGGAGLVAARLWDAPAAEGLVHLSASEAAFVRALAAAAYPATPAIAVDANDLALDAFFDAAIGNLPPFKIKLIKVGMSALDALPLTTHGARFTRLSPDAQAALVVAWNEHDRPELRQALNALLVVAGMGYCTHPSVAPFFQAMHRCGYGR